MTHRSICAECRGDIHNIFIVSVLSRHLLSLVDKVLSCCHLLIQFLHFLQKLWQRIYSLSNKHDVLTVSLYTMRISRNFDKNHNSASVCNVTKSATK